MKKEGKKMKEQDKKPNWLSWIALGLSIIALLVKLFK